MIGPNRSHTGLIAHQGELGQVHVGNHHWQFLTDVTFHDAGGLQAREVSRIWLATVRDDDWGFGARRLRRQKSGQRGIDLRPGRSMNLHYVGWLRQSHSEDDCQRGGYAYESSFHRRLLPNNLFSLLSHTWL